MPTELYDGEREIRRGLYIFYHRAIYISTRATTKMDHRTARHEGALKDTFSSKKFKMLRNQANFSFKNVEI